MGDADGKSNGDADGNRAGPPEWLNVEFINKALKNSGDNVHVDNIEITYAVPPGNNFCSSMFRVATHIRGETGPRSLLVKIPPEGETFAKMVDDGGLFQKETLMFSEIIPTICNLLQKYCKENLSSPLAAKCYYHGNEPKRFLVLQDLIEKDFYLADRCKGLNLNQATLVMETLGRFHGASHFLFKENPEMFEIMTNPFEGAGMMTQEDTEDSLNTIAASIGEWSELYEEKLQKVKIQIYIRNQIANRPRPGKFNVLAHGDLWTNNIMFRDNDKGETIDVRLLDFQMCHVTNPAIDVILFLYTSLEEDVFCNSWNDLLNIYVDSLATTLTHLGLEAITLDELQDCIEEAQAYAFIAILMWLPLVRMKKGNFDVEKMLNEGASTQVNTYRTPEFTHWMKKLLPEFDNRGMFDFK